MYSASFVVAFAGVATALNNGVGKLPKMGYDTFNAFACNYNGSDVLAQVESMAKLGLVKAGYNVSFSNNRGKIAALAEPLLLASHHPCNYLTISLWPKDPIKFPNGMKNFTDSMKAYGVSASAYSDNGYETCAGYPGAYGHELQDLTTWDEWGFNYLKYDNCYIPFDNITQENMFGRYQRMSDAIAEYAGMTGKFFEYSLCEWGWQQPWVWGKQISQGWRIDGDIKPFWSAITAIIDQASFLWWATDFYGRNDMDIMEVGNTGQGSPPGNLTYEEAKSHFTAWALLKSHLIIGTDLTNATNETIEILGNTDLIKINQDPNVGQSINPFRWGINPDYVSNSSYPAQYWSGNSSYGVVFMVLNTQNSTEQMFFNLTESWVIRAGRQYSVYDMWSHTHNGTAVRNMTLTLPAHGVSALLLNDAGPEPADAGPPYCGFFYQCAFPNGTYASN